MNARIAVPVAAAAAWMFSLSPAAFAVGFSIADGCGKVVAGSSSATISVNAAGDVAVTQFTAPYSVGLGSCNVLPSGAEPICVLTASQNKIQINETVRLHANCSVPAGQPVTSYTWLAPASPALPGNHASLSTIDLTFPTPGLYSYAIGGVNANGPGGGSPQVTIMVANSQDPAAVPSCIATISPASVASGGSANAIVVCHPPAASHAWDAPEAGAPAGSPGTLTFSAGGTFTYKVAGRNAAGVAGPKTSATVTVAAPPGPSCNHSAVNYDIATVVNTFTSDYAMYNGWVAAFSFQIPANAYTTLSASGASYRMPDGVDVSISQCRGDFTPTGSCLMSTYGNWGITARTSAGAGCQIQPNTTYYLNVRQNDCWNAVNPGLCGFRVWRAPN